MAKSRNRLEQDGESSSLLFKLGSLVTALFLGLLATVAFLLFQGSSSGTAKEVLIPRGASIARVVDILATENVISRPTVFKLVLRFTQGLAQVRAGEFRFRENMRPIDAMMVVYYAEPIVHTVTFPEGWNARQIAAHLAEKGLVNKERFISLALDKKTAEKMKLSSPHLEGFLYPETYTFSRVDGEERILEIMVNQFKATYDKHIRSSAEKMGWTQLEVVTFASIVEKETGKSGERELVASVFHNRLKKKMRLESDPTTIYGIENFNGNLTRADLRRFSPYNTYVIKSLPPGPIASPGLASMRATIAPAMTNYLFFVSNNRGEHIFSETYAQHARQVTAFQSRGRNK